MSFEYLYHHQPPYPAAVDDEQHPTGGIQFQFPDHRAQYPQYNLVQDAFHSLESLHGAFPTTYHQQPSRWALNASPPPDDPSPLTASGLPVYSQSGFDVVSLLSRVQNRANPSISLGPVDFTTSFVVVDVRRHDHPIVYCSPSFCALTGYSERAILGRNCRFLQAPPSPSAPLAKGDARRHTSLPAVRTLAKAVGGHKEAQVSVVNYRADGSAFVNLVSLVPLFGEHVDDPSPHAECVWYVGFQIDLTKASEGIVERVRDGTYYSGAVVSLQAQQQQQPKAKAIEPPVAPQTRERRAHPVPAPRVAPLLARLLRTPAFLTSCGIHLSQPTVSSTGTNAVAMTGFPPDPTSHALHSLLLEQLPDFVHVLSLKGAFLYVAPAVTRVLGWAPAELVGRTLADVCFTKDVSGRALKEASLPIDGVRIDASKDEDGTANSSNSGSTTPATNPHATNNTVTGGSGAGPPAALTPAEALRTVDLVFRARTKGGSWVWVECRGRLHVEPGKGRKAIVLTTTNATRTLRTRLRTPAPQYGSPTRDAYGAPTFFRDEDYFDQPMQTQTQGFPARSPTGSVSGLEYALQPIAKRAKVEDAYTRGSSGNAPSPLTSTSTSLALALQPTSTSTSLLLGATPAPALPPAFHGRRLSAAGTPSAIEQLLAAVQRDAEGAAFAASTPSAGPNPRNPGGGAREVRCMLQGQDGPVDAVVRIVAPLPPTAPLPPAVAPAHLMYAVRLASAPPSSLSASHPSSPSHTRGGDGVVGATGDDVFKRLDPATGGSWQYELQQLRFANARLEEEIGALERAEAEREGDRAVERAAEREREREAREAREGMERERERARAVYQHQQQVQQHQQTQAQMYSAFEFWGAPLPPPPPSSSRAYQLPMKRAWDEV
ncbi:hypothetical protein B0H14DRAFT_2930809 [Mycena olivaceomarginata]|nr:hypothetical protein B0H14DRAFT_2930809 [Mycena olivaceomarginata]